eukprot:3682637-Amphidinium_carterae.4
MIAVPLAAASEYHEAIEAPVFGPGEERRHSAQLAALCDFPDEFASGLVVRLVGETAEDTMLSVHRNGVQADGSGEEAFHSSAELPQDYDPRSALRPPVPKRKAKATSTAIVPKTPASSAGAKAKGAAAPKRGAGAAVPPPVGGKLDNDALAMITNAITVLSERMEKLEGNKGMARPGGASASSLLNPGRVGTGSSSAAVPMAKSILQGIPPPSSEPTPRVGRPRASESAYQAIAEGTSVNAQAAVQLATLEALEKILKRQSASGDPLEDLAEEDDFETGLSKVTGGARGAYAMQRMNRSIEAAPQRWSQMCDDAMARALGVHVTGLPWSALLYAQQRIRFGKCLDLERMFHMLASLHAAHRANDHALVGARISQFMKATEQAVNQGGNWRLAWCLTNLPEPRPGNHLQYGMSSPAEIAASVQFLKDSRAVEELVRKEAAGDTPQNTGGPTGGWNQNRNKKGAGKGKDGPSAPGATGGEKA